MNHMKVWSFAVLLLICTAPLFAQDRAKKNVDDERSILALRDSLFKAYDSGDLKTLAEVEADDFTLASDFAQMTKQQHLDSVRHREKPQLVTRNIDNQFRFYGDIALLTEVDHAQDAEGGKSDFQTSILWVRHGNTWRAAHMHYSKIEPNP
jgi:ketosteroid isomerase-like protein